MAAAPIENKSDCDQRGATSNDLNCKEGTTRAIGRWHHCHDQCEKRHQKTRPAHQPAYELSAWNESDFRILASCTATQHRKRGEHI